MAEPQKYTALIIDDNDVTRSMLRHILSSESCYEVIGEASSGLVGLEMVERRKPDIVCLDIHMQDSNGLDLLTRIKQRWPKMVVLMVTGSNDRPSVLAAVRGGANGYIVKPFNPSTLLRTVEQAIAKAQA